MTLLPKAEAEAEPVGEAWDEPNVNPRLEKPSEGRGFADKLAATTFIDLGNLKMP